MIWMSMATVADAVTNSGHRHVGRAVVRGADSHEPVESGPPEVTRNSMMSFTFGQV